jgi:hypothetical protein
MLGVLSPSTNSLSLPRPFPFWKDFAYWCWQIYLIPILYWDFWLLRSLGGSDTPGLITLLIVITGLPLLMLWLIRDTYRWAVDRRGRMLLIYGFTVGVLGAIHYLRWVRPQHLMDVRWKQAEAEREARQA